MAGSRAPWPTEAEDALRRLWPDYSATGIARVLNNAGFACTRCAVIGKAHRLGLTRKAPAGRPTIPWTDEIDDAIRERWGKCTGETLAQYIGEAFGLKMADTTIHARALRIGLTRLREAQRTNRYFRLGNVGNRNKRPTPPKHVPEPSPPPVARMVSLLDLEPGACHFPINDPRNADFGFCGAPKWESSRSYCEYHHRLCYRPPEQRKRRSQVNWSRPVDYGGKREYRAEPIG